MEHDLAPVQFAVVKFVADPIRDEPVNVGIIGTSAEGLDTRFIDSLTRLKNVVEDEDIKALSVAIKFLRSSLERSPKSLHDLREQLYGQIRLSDLMGGLADDPNAFLDDQFEIYVSSSTAIKRAQVGEDRTKVKDRIRKAIGGMGKQSEFFALRKARVKGNAGRHTFDFGAVNGHPTLMQAISFQTREDYALREAKLLAWAALDTTRAHEDLHVAAIIAPPRDTTETYDEALKVLRSENATIVDSSTEDLDRFIDGIMSSPEVRPIPADWLETPEPAA